MTNADTWAHSGPVRGFAHSLGAAVRGQGVDDQLALDVRWTVFPTLLAQHRQSRSAQRYYGALGCTEYAQQRKRRPTLEDVSAGQPPFSAPTEGVETPDQMS